MSLLLREYHIPGRVALASTKYRHQSPWSCGCPPPSVWGVRLKYLQQFSRFIFKKINHLYCLFWLVCRFDEPCNLPPASFWSGFWLFLYEYWLWILINKSDQVWPFNMNFATIFYCNISRFSSKRFVTLCIHYSIILWCCLLMARRRLWSWPVGQRGVNHICQQLVYTWLKTWRPGLSVHCVSK